MLNQAQKLVETGRHAAAVDLLQDRPEEELNGSPTLALLYGIAQAKVGLHAFGAHWVQMALERARERGDRAIEARALNVSGAIALEHGDIDQAAECFTGALAEAERDGDHATVGRCSNNLGIIANMRGDYGRAVGSFTLGLAAFQQAGLQAGIAEALHNLAISYRDQGDLDNALRTASQAVDEAGESGDVGLAALTHGGRAEIRLLAGDAKAALREVERAAETHRDLGNAVAEAEDLRVLAGALAETGEPAEAERLLNEAIERSDRHRRPLLGAQARRDLARLMHRLGRGAEARELARTARASFSALGARVEAEALDKMIDDLD